MRSTLRRSIRRPVLAAVLAASLPAAGCDAFGPRHDTITIEVEASQGATVRLITSHDFTVAYSYDDTGNRLSLSLNGAVLFAYSYDAAGRLATVIYDHHDNPWFWVATARYACTP